MSERQYNIIFRGDIVFGCQLSDVKLRLQQLFKTDEAKINALFTGKPVALKRHLDLAGAEKYRAALLSAGAQVVIVAAEDAAQLARSPAVTAAAAQPIREGNESWSLAPVGTNLLKAAEHAVVVTRDIDISSLQLRPVGGDLLEPNEKRPVLAKVVAPDFALASVGAELLRSEERLTAAVSTVAVGDWGLAAVGADLIRDDEREIVLSGLITIPDLGLAPVGADLGQIQPETKHFLPDISGIHLAD